MNMRELAWSLTIAQPRATAAGEVVAMDEDSFRVLYEQTARPLLAYLSRASGSAEMARDLLQEAYFHLLRARNLPEDEIGLRKYLFRIAGNLLRDHWRRHKRELAAAMEAAQQPAAVSEPPTYLNVQSVLDQLKPREREMLWLAYVEEYDQREIAAITGLRYSSIRMLLFRARHKLAALLRGVEAGKARSI
jgi:RNA polymerase sigma-70 factor (ECF subfamily)